MRRRRRRRKVAMAGYSSNEWKRTIDICFTAAVRRQYLAHAEQRSGNSRNKQVAAK
jgi:hypothetical protein